ncbi:hypothetical protein R50345_17490 [Paenibacillus sp. FSL R5-0345]|uniref:DUF2252 family protein n=1 Tax=Paenibacillus sp. FSL R5-0345 TaxID=1536770 RepID=UPI0004F74154|nr:DUF2252 family protein [Paenibacillus sp. FSL R5-0345]AIQ36264.1 hypothetical protein R50345_17490 [Paenibacillus sp. FSL R5-0345]
MKKIVQRWISVAIVSAMFVQSLWVLAGTGYAAADSTNTDNLAENIVISHFYGGKKDDVLDVYSSDFVELFNPTSKPISLNGWSLQFADNQKNNWKIANLGAPTAQIPAYGYYLVALGSNGNVGAQLPQADAVEGSFKLGNNSGKLALLNTNQKLTDNDPMKDSLKDNVVDFVGYDAVDAFWGSPAPQAGKQNTMQRLVFDPLEPTSNLTSASFPNSGNNWDTKNNGKDFEKVKGAKARNSSSPAAYAFLENNQTVQMKSSSAVDSDHNTIILKAFNAVLKQGAWASGDFNVIGLPAGFSASAAASGEQITITISGDGSGNVESDANLTFNILPGAWNQGNKPTEPVTVYQKTNTVTLAKFTPSNKIVAPPDSSTIPMSSAKDMNALLRLKLNAGTAVDGTLSANAYSVVGLPAGDWKITAEGQSSSNTITISISGTAASAVMDTVPLNVTLKPQAVQDSGWVESDAIGISILRYSQPVLSDEARKQVVEQRIIADNTGFNDPVTKEYKYGSNAMGANAYTFLRGTNSLFKSDQANHLIPSPDSIIAGWKDKDILTYTQGDAHIQNVGTFNDSTETMVFSLNDVDSAGIGSFYDDLIRFVTSIYVVKYDKDSSGIANLQDADFREVSAKFLETYKDTLTEINNDNSKKITKLTKSNVTAYTKTVMDSASKVSYAEALQKLLSKRALNGKLNIAGNSDKFELATEAETTSLHTDWENYKAQVRGDFPNLTDEQFDAYFTIKDIVRRIHQGIGSIGVERYNVLIEGGSGANTDDILLDVKEQTRDAYLSKDAYIKTAVDPDVYLGVLEASSRSYLIREVSPFKGDYTDKPFKNKDELEQYLIDAAKAYAYTDSRLDKVSDELNYKFEERFVTNVLPVWSDLKNFILNAAEDYSHQVVADFALVQSDMLAGTLIDVSTLDDLTVQTGTLSPSFAAGITEYTVTVDHSVESIELMAKATDAKAELTAQGQSYANGTGISFELSVGAIEIPFAVTARDGSTKTYTVIVTRSAAEEASGSTDLSALTLSSGTLSPAFGSEITEYSAHVDNEIASITVTASVYDSSASFTVNGTPAVNGQASGTISLNVGSNVIPIVVTSSDGISNTYTVIVTRAEAATTQPTEPSNPSTSTGGTDQVNPSVNSGTVPANGGVLTLNGVKINVPAGAMDNGITITVTKLEDTVNLFSGSDLKLLGDIYEIIKNKEGDFAKAITITLPFDKTKVDFNKSIVGLYWLNEQTKKWVHLDNLQVDQESGTVSGTVTHFTKFAVLVSEKTVAPSPSPDVDFVDIKGHWAEISIRDLVKLGAINGYPDNTFKPDSKITRAEFVSIIVKAFGLQADVGKVFGDTKTHWANEAIATAAALGVVNGYNNGNFGPDEIVTREQVATIVVRAAQLVETDMSMNFSDSAKVSTWARPALGAAIAEGLLEGYTDGTLKPQGSTTRAEAATIILRALTLKK